MSGRHQLAEVSDLEDLLDHVEKRIIKRYLKHHDFEDLLQEAKVYAWREWENGNRDRWDILRIANNRARNLYQDKSGSQQTGKPPKSKDFSTNAKGEATRVKIRSYIEEFVNLHDRKPTTNEVADGVGMKYATVWHQLKQIEVRRESVAIDVTMWSMPLDIEDGTMNPPAGGLAMGEDGNFETKLIRRLVIAEYLDRCPEKERLALYYKFWEDRTNQGIADGLGGYTAQVGANWLKKGLERLRTLMNADAEMWMELG